ncbi:gltp-b [Symbiodinium natans]|uniref:Gltp-b protein n=1 Tax=Symbiodinium natans TaxID=878477 RepID=A0A812V872_9DINO|nr:gltp-b [Symbiodinium natans]
MPWAQVVVQEEIDVRKGPAAKAEAPEPSSTASTASPAPSVEEIPPAPAPVEAPAAEARRKAISSLLWFYFLGAPAQPEVVEAPAEVAKAPEPEAAAPVEEAKPVVHETRPFFVRKFHACEMRDESGAITDIDMAKFFEACELYRDMLSKLGSAAGVVLGDITSNLKKARVVYEEAPEERKTFSGYLKASSVVGATWLLRGCEFFLTMIKLMFTQESGNAGVEAYKQTLMQYHGWMLQKTVKLGMRAMPGKDGIVKSEGLVLVAASPEQKTKLCERDAPAASNAGLELVQWMVELMKKEGRKDTGSVFCSGPSVVANGPSTKSGDGPPVAVQEEIDVRKGPAAKAEAPEPSSTASTASPAPSVEEIPPAPAPVEAPAAVVEAPAEVAKAPEPEAAAPVEEAKPVVHETRFGILLEKFHACEMRDESGAITDIDMAKFFEACELYRDMLSKLGSAAGVVLGDITSNLKKARVVYEEAPEERKTFSGYLKASSVVGCTWLLRGCEFFLTMIKLMFTQESGNAGVEAYKQTLMQYHGWMLQKTVKLGMRAMPGKDGIVKSEGLVLVAASPEQKTKLCERDAPAASNAGLELNVGQQPRVQWMVELMKKEGKWDAGVFFCFGPSVVAVDHPRRVVMDRPNHCSSLLRVWLQDLRSSPALYGIFPVAVQEEIDVRKGPASQAEAPEPSSAASTASPASPAPAVEEASPGPAPVEAPAAVPAQPEAAAPAEAAKAPEPEAAAPVEEAKPVVHETRFGLLLEKFHACEMRDESGAVTDIDMAKFFEACELYRDMLSKLGSAAGVVLGDITTNLKNSRVVYEESPEERKTFSGYLPKAPSVAKITWLLRGCELFLTMIKLMFTQEGGSPGVEAYKQTLMQYHGWMLQKTVKLGMRAMPGKDGVMKSEGLILGEVSPEQRTKLCERDAPAASIAGLEVVHWMYEKMKKEGRWDAKKA